MYTQISSEKYAELRGGMIYISQLLEDAQFLRKWEENNKFLKYFSMSTKDTYKEHSFLFEIFDKHSLYLISDYDIDREIKKLIEDITEIQKKNNEVDKGWALGIKRCPTR